MQGQGQQGGEVQGWGHGRGQAAPWSGWQVCPLQPVVIAWQGQGLPWCEAASTLPWMGQQWFALLEEPSSGCERVAEPGAPAHMCEWSCTCLAHTGMCRAWADPLQQHLHSLCSHCLGSSGSV